MRSRLKSHLTEVSPTAFHSGLGRVDPVAVRLELARGFGEEGSHEDRVALLAALLHERHHWLQHVGTNAGLFGTLLLEFQTGMVEHVPLEELRAGDLPLLAHEERYADALGRWERLEATRRLFFGCRRGDLEVLARDGRAPLWREIVPLIGEAMGTLLADSPRLRKYRAFLDSPDSHLPITPEVLEVNGWSVGARHLMEGAARQSETHRLLRAALLDHRDARAAAEEFAFDLSRHRTGVYGVARTVFDQFVRTPTAAADIGFAYACDLALNACAPPLYPFVPLNPGVLFAHVAQRLGGFRFDRMLDFTDPLAARELIAELTEHLRGGDPDLSQALDIRRVLVESVLGHLRPDEVAGRIFTDRGPGRLPEPTGPSSRLRYLLALTAEAERIRADAPEFFVFPSASFTADRAAFRETFARIGPPLVSYGPGGMTATRRDPGWGEFFLAAGLHYEVLRGVVMLDAEALGAGLAPYVTAGGGLVRTVLTGALRGAPVAEVIWRHAEAAAEGR
ncbi:hypothetical protein ACL02R_11130 [Streptomyces sp. MS19]|uniref:hypothetical protein n=1 Tax=Streptomyces sp. MS19 TaxID=3385972 RepID=UPI0039A316C3